MSQPVAPTPLQAHTLDTLLDELVSGRPVVLSGDGEVFQLGSTEARSVFAWYRAHRDKWSKNTSKEDVEAIVDQLDITPPVLPSLSPARGIHGKRTLFLKSLRAHRFGGIHRFGTVNDAPPDFCFSFEKSLTIVEGANGAGKTSVLSAIMWCLTGYVYCPLRPPEQADQVFSVATEIAAIGSDGTKLSWDMLPITPMPTAGNC